VSAFAYYDDRRVEAVKIKNELVAVGWKKEIVCICVCSSVCARWKSYNNNKSSDSNSNNKNLVPYVRFPCSLRCFSVPKVQASAAWNQHQRQVRTQFSTFVALRSYLSSLLYLSVALLIVQMPQIQHPMTIDMYSFIHSYKCIYA